MARTPRGFLGCEDGKSRPRLTYARRHHDEIVVSCFLPTQVCTVSYAHVHDKNDAQWRELSASTNDEKMIEIAMPEAKGACDMVLNLGVASVYQRMLKEWISKAREVSQSRKSPEFQVTSHEGQSTCDQKSSPNLITWLNGIKGWTRT